MTDYLILYAGGAAFTAALPVVFGAAGLRAVAAESRPRAVAALSLGAALWPLACYWMASDAVRLTTRRREVAQ